MIKIITDTSTLYSVNEGKSLGVDILPLNVSIAGKQYREYEEISPREFCDIIKSGEVPISSQPSIGETLECFDKNKDHDILVISMADGLSGTYSSTVGVRETYEPNEHIHIINSKTLCGPHRYLVQQAVKMRDEGKTLQEIMQAINYKITTAISFLLPQDFEFLRRGGRVTATAAKLGGFLKIQPVVMQTEDGKRLEKFTTGRNFDIAIKTIIKHLESIGINEKHKLFVSHGFVEQQAQGVVEKLKAIFPNTEIELLTLSCAFLTQGGPGCVAIQAIEK